MSTTRTIEITSAQADLISLAILCLEEDMGREGPLAVLSDASFFDSMDLPVLDEGASEEDEDEWNDNALSIFAQMKDDLKRKVA